MLSIRCLLGFCNHEYLHDQVTGRESLVTEYNFS
jgi:hypothetical protein